MLPFTISRSLPGSWRVPLGLLFSGRGQRSRRSFNAKRDDQFPSGFNSAGLAIGLRAGAKPTPQLPIAIVVTPWIDDGATIGSKELESFSTGD